MQNPPPPPPPPSGMPPAGQPPMMPPGAPGQIMVPAGNLANPWLRIVGGLIDVIILAIVAGIINRALNDKTGIISLVIGLILYVAYFAYFWSQRGQSVGMMVFGFKVRDVATGQFPDVGKAALRGFIWYLEVAFTICIVGAIGWLWQLWDPQRQAIHDKVAGTIVTAS